MGNSEQIFETIFNKNLLVGDTKDFLAELVKQHPYFTPAQFYLLKQTDTKDIAYPKQAAKTSLLFNNPFWLDYQLNQSVATPLIQEQSLITGEELAPTVYNNEIESLEKIQPVIETTDKGFEESKEEMHVPEKVFENQLLNDTNAGVVYDLTTSQLKSTDANIESVEKATPVSDQRDVDFKNEENIEFAGTTGLEGLPQKDYDTEPALNSLATVALQLADKSIEQNYSEQQYLEDKEQEDELPPEGKEIEPMNIKLNFTTAIATTEDTITFEPLHTSDYFASVGIKFNDDVKPGDKLGKQLKSFTDWLKTMKKIHSDQLAPQSEQSVMVIQKMAEKSNTEAEVLTEAMADVLLQQGKNSKAIEVYKKLSLLNPSKSAYFAAKIDDIEKEVI